MKKTLIIAFTLMVVSLFGQNDTLMSNVEAHWRFNNFLADISGSTNGWQSYDSLINDNILINNKYWSTYYVNRSTNSNNKASAYINIDSGKIYCKFIDYLIIKDTTNIHLLYDYNITVGDTIGFDLDNSPIKLIEIGDTLVSGQNLKYYKFNNLDLWIEKIGSVYGLLNPIVNVLYFGGGRELCHYSGSSIDSIGISYNLKLGNEFNCIAAVLEDELEFFNIIVTDNSIEIRSDLNETLNRYIDLYDINGKLVFHDRIKKSNQIIDWSNFNSGLYIIKVDSQSEKIVKY